MTRTINLTANVPPNHEVHIVLPDDVPVGPAELVVVVTSRTGIPVPTLNDFVNSEFFGMWRDRTDITASVEFARRLRREAWSRSL